MGYKKLDEVMELLSDELDGFNKAIDRLERLTQNVDDINIKPDTSEVESMLWEHLSSEKSKSSKFQESVHLIERQLSKARMIPKIQLWLNYSIWMISIIIIGFLAFSVSRISQLQEKAFAKGEQEVLFSLREYFDQNPKHYQSYREWIMEKDSVPDRK